MKAQHKVANCCVKVFLLIGSLFSVSAGHCCTLGPDSSWNDTDIYFYKKAASIYVVKVEWVKVLKDGRKNEVKFHTLRMIKGKSEGNTFLGTYKRDSSISEKANYGMDCEPVITPKVGETYIYIPVRNNSRMIERFSESREKEIRQFLEMK